MTDESRSQDQSDHIRDEKSLRQHYEPTLTISRQKVVDRLDHHCRTFISLSPFLCIATTRPDACNDVSPRGDRPGFVQVTDDRTLVIPDRPGNNRLDTLSNLTANPHVGLIFFIPGISETLRVTGTARVLVDSALADRLKVNGRAPRTCLEVKVREAYMHCAKAIKRSRLWQDDYRVERGGALASFAETLADHAASGTTADEIQDVIDESQRERMW